MCQVQVLLLYMAILVVFLLAYGVTTLALQYPTRPKGLSNMRIFRDIFYFPYWQIYGELFLEELEGTHRHRMCTRVRMTLTVVLLYDFRNVEI